MTVGEFPEYVDVLLSIAMGVMLGLLILILGTLGGAIAFVVRGYKKDGPLKLALLALGIIAFLLLQQIDRFAWVLIFPLLVACAAYPLVARVPSQHRFDSLAILSLLACCFGLSIIVSHWVDVYSARSSFGIGLGMNRGHSLLSLDSDFPFLHSIQHPDGPFLIEGVGGRKLFAGHVLLWSSVLLAACSVWRICRSSKPLLGSVFATTVALIAAGRSVTAFHFYSPLVDTARASHAPEGFQVALAVPDDPRWRSPLADFQTLLLDENSVLSEYPHPIREDPFLSIYQRANGRGLDRPRLLVDRRAKPPELDRSLRAILEDWDPRQFLAVGCDFCDIVDEIPIIISSSSDVDAVFVLTPNGWQCDGQPLADYVDQSDLSGAPPRVGFAVASVDNWQQIAEIAVGCNEDGRVRCHLVLGDPEPSEPRSKTLESTPR